MWSCRGISGVPAGPQARRAALALTLCICGLALAFPTGLGARGQALPLSNPRDLLSTDPGAFARLLETARPTPVSAGDKARILSSLPETGEITNLNARALQKLAALSRVLRATDSVYVVKVIAVPQAAIGLHARTILLISEAALTLLNVDELQALVAHEIGHEYVWLEYERAFALADRNRLKELELVCDGIAIITLYGLGMDPSRLMAGVDKIGRFNRERFGTAVNEGSYPTLAQRRAFAQALTAVLH
jgi:hypothetical protein